MPLKKNYKKTYLKFKMFLKFVLINLRKYLKSARLVEIFSKIVSKSQKKWKKKDK